MKTLMLCAGVALLCRLIAAGLEATRYKDSAKTAYDSPDDDPEWHRRVDSSIANHNTQAFFGSISKLALVVFVVRLALHFAGVSLYGGE